MRFGLRAIRCTRALAAEKTQIINFNPINNLHIEDRRNGNCILSLHSHTHTHIKTHCIWVSWSSRIVYILLLAGFCMNPHTHTHWQTFRWLSRDTNDESQTPHTRQCTDNCRWSTIYMYIYICNLKKVAAATSVFNNPSDRERPPWYKYYKKEPQRAWTRRRTGEETNCRRQRGDDKKPVNSPYYMLSAFHSIFFTYFCVCVYVKYLVE